MFLPQEDYRYGVRMFSVSVNFLWASQEMFNVRVKRFWPILVLSQYHRTNKLSTSCLILISQKKHLEYAGPFLVSLNLMVPMLHHLSMIGREKLLIPKIIFLCCRKNGKLCSLFTHSLPMNEYQIEINYLVPVILAFLLS